MDCESVERVLDRSESLLYSHLVLSPSVIDQLRDEDVISDSAKKKMTDCNSQQQIELLIECLRKRGSSTFKRFLGVLRRTFHGSLADKLVLCDPVRFSDAIVPDGDLHNPLPRTDNVYKYNLSNDFQPQPGHDMYFTYPEEKPKTDTDQTENGEATKQYESPKFVLEEGLPDGDVNGELSQIRSYFETQQSTTARVLAALKQEEIVIRELLDQDSKEQEQFRQNRSTLEEINRRVKEISSRTGYLADATPRLSISDFRLATLNTLPWTAGKTD